MKARVKTLIELEIGRDLTKLENEQLDIYFDTVYAPADPPETPEELFIAVWQWIRKQL